MLEFVIMEEDNQKEEKKKSLICLRLKNTVQRKIEERERIKNYILLSHKSKEILQGPTIYTNYHISTI